MMNIKTKEIGAFDDADDELDGLDESSIDSDSWGADYPLEPIAIDEGNRTLVDVVRQINNGRFVLDPDFQRPIVWTQFKQSKLIESCILKIPLPVFYLAKGKDKKITVVDGLQRLTTFRDFLNNEFELKFQKGSVSAETASELTGKKFDDLKSDHQYEIEDTQLKMYILAETIPEQAKLDIFERVNSGVPLTRQQMRNALFCGDATKWLKKVVDGEGFKKTIKNSLNRRTMRDREAVNRIVSIKLLGLDSYKGQMDDFLVSGIKELSKLETRELDKLLVKIEEVMIFCYKVFGDKAFRKPDSPKTRKRTKSRLNISLFDAITVAFLDNIDKLKKLNSNKINDGILKLLKEKKFNDSITISTNSAKAVKYRHYRINKFIDDLLSGK